MEKINFKQFKQYRDIEKQVTDTVDIRKEFANLLYTKADGIGYHALALKIYNSKGDVEINEEEKALMIGLVNAICTPVFIDSLNDNLKSTEYATN